MTVGNSILTRSAAGRDVAVQTKGGNRHIAQVLPRVAVMAVYNFLAKIFGLTVRRLGG